MGDEIGISTDSFTPAVRARLRDVDEL